MDEVVAVLAAGAALLNHVGFVNQLHLYHTDDDRQKEVLLQDVRLTPIYHKLEEVEGLSVQRGLAQGHRHKPVLDHLLGPLQTAIATITAAVQGLDLNEGRPDHGGRLAVLYHLPEEGSEGVEGDQFLVVIVHDPTHTLNLLAHVRPEDAGRSLHRHRRAFHRHHRQDIAKESDGVLPIHDPGLFPGIVMAGEVGRAEDLGDQTQFTHRTIEEFHGLMLSRTIPHETSVV